MISSTWRTWKEYLTPVSHQSTFYTTGQLTPGEFIQTGEYLVHMFPTWHWNQVDNGDKLQIRDFLPNGRQFLVSRKVPCRNRVDDYQNNIQDLQFDEEFITNESSSSHDKSIEGNKGGDGNEIGDIDFDMAEKLNLHDADDENDNVNDDEVVFQQDGNLRYYDLYIGYSTSYRVPKFYLVGYNAEGLPLTPEQMFQDISIEYRTKTATIEKLPFFKDSILSISIHPCKHAHVMKILLDKIRTIKKQRKRTESKINSNKRSDDQEPEKEDDWEDLQDDVDDNLQIDQYLVVFLKFINSITPTIEHDYTMESW